MRYSPLLLILIFGLTTVEIPTRSFGTAFAEGGEEGGEKKAAKSKKSKKKKKKKEAAVEVLDEKPEIIVATEDASASAFNEQLEKPPEIDAVLVLDASGSMERTDPKRLRDQAAKLFLRSLGEEDRVAILQFDSEVKSLSEFTAVSEESIATLDSIVTGVSTKGLRTNLEAPVVAALELLKSSAREGTTKTVVLLSDGQMDPDHDPAVGEELLKKLFESDLPAYRAAQIRLYTLALSEEADKTLLQDMAKATDALSWYAADVSSIHAKFSDLFLALKQPQVAPIEGGGFSIDQSVREATFYITRKNPEQEISLLTPKGSAVTQTEFPLGTRWYRGEMFDIITIPKPLSGQWSVRGVEEPDGFATLLTDLKLQVKWPSPNLRIGDTVHFFARLASDEQILADPNIAPLLDYRYRVVSAKSGAAVLSGVMKDDGSDGDEKAGDGIFVGSVKVEDEGDYKLLLGVSTPTFVRQQVIPFTVSKGLVSLALKPGDAFAGTQPVFEIILGEETKKLRDVEVKLLAELVGAAPSAEHGEATEETHGESHESGETKPQVLGLKAVKSPSNSLLYTVDAGKLPGGVYKVSAVVRGKEGKKKEEVRGESETIDFTSTAEVVAPVEETPAEPADTSWIFGLISVLISALWGGAAIFFVVKKLDFGKGLPPKEKRYQRPASLNATLEELKGKLSDDRRKPNPQDFSVFEIVKEVLGKPEAPPPAEDAPGGPS